MRGMSAAPNPHASPPNSSGIDDHFELWDLRVEVVCPPGERVMCGAKAGDHFELRGEMLHLPPGQGFSIYSLAALLPLLPAKQRLTHPNDWMSSDAEVACPDPHCPTRLRITRTAKRRFSHAATTQVPLPGTTATPASAARATSATATSTIATSASASVTAPARPIRPKGRA
jgi:uncharacterized repeat protein (TIGR04076 family)